MPIKGLTNRGMKFPEIGNIRKGAPKKKGERMKDLKHFRAVFDESETEAAALFFDAYGETPTEIRIVLPFDEIKRCWDPHLEAYTASQMIAKSDGEIYLYRRDGITGEVLVKDGKDVKTGQRVPYVEGEAAGYYLDKKDKKKPVYCANHGRLKVIILELKRLAYVTVHTSSIYDIIEISENLEALKFMNGGILKGVDMILKRKPKKVSTPMAGEQRRRVEKWMLSVEAAPDWVDKQMNGTKQRLELAQVEEIEVEALPDGVDEDELEGVIEAEEETATPTTEETRRHSMTQQGWAIDIIGNKAEAIKALDASALDADATQKEISMFAHAYMNTDGGFVAKVDAGGEAAKKSKQ